MQCALAAQTPARTIHAGWQSQSPGTLGSACKARAGAHGARLRRAACAGHHMDLHRLVGDQLHALRGAREAEQVLPHGETGGVLRAHTSFNYTLRVETPAW